MIDIKEKKKHELNFFRIITIILQIKLIINILYIDFDNKLFLIFYPFKFI